MSSFNDSTQHVFVMNSEGNFTRDYVSNYFYSGSVIRPVITLKKSALN